MEFLKHQDPIMGMYVVTQEPDIFGRTSIEHVFNLAENPELAEQYLTWLAEQEAPDAN